MKPVEEETAETANISAPSKAQTEGHQGTTGEVNGFISPSEEAPLVPQSALLDGSAAPSSSTTQTPLKKPTSLQEEGHPQELTPSPLDMTQPQPQAEGERQPCPPTTNGFSPDSTETSALSPYSLSDSDLIEAVLDSSTTGRPMPEETADSSVCVPNKETSLPETDDARQNESNITGEENGGSNNTVSHLTETAGGEEQAHIIVKTRSQDEVICSKQSAPQSNVATLSEGIEAFDVPDGLESEIQDLPSVSEAASPSPQPEPKKKGSIFKRSKKKSNSGNLSLCVNKSHVWNASRLMCLKEKSLLLFFIFHLTFYILCFGYFSVYS